MSSRSRSRRTSFPGAAQLLVRGFIKERGGKTIELISDGTLEGHYRDGHRAWFRGVDVSQGAGRTMAECDSLQDRRMAPCLLVGWTLTLWFFKLRHRVHGSPRRMRRAKQLSRPPSRRVDAQQETWLQIAASGDLDLVINGHLITAAVGSSSGTGLPHLDGGEGGRPFPANGKHAEGKSRRSSSQAIF